MTDKQKKPKWFRAIRSMQVSNFNIIQSIFFRIWMFSSLKIANFAARRFFYHTKKQELSDYQSNAFERLGLNYLEAKNLTNKVCQELFGSTFNNSNGMHSEHLVYFSALKLSGFKPKNILEIGTFKGETSSFIAKLFPDSMIRTLDISTKEMKEKNIYL
jgi:hypothetical protein